MVTTTKPCKKCHCTFPLEMFYAHPGMADGHLNVCKKCIKQAAHNRRLANPEKYAAYDKQRATEHKRVQARAEYSKTPEGRAARLEAQARARQRMPEKFAARSAVAFAVRTGKLMRCPCERCGALRVEAHHDDYSKPLAVRWLCKQHHQEHHQASRLTPPPTPSPSVVGD